MMVVVVVIGKKRLRQDIHRGFRDDLFDFLLSNLSSLQREFGFF